MRRFITPLLTACLILGLAGCAAEGGDPTEAVPTGVFQVVYVPSVAGLWDGAESLVNELRGAAPKLADEAVGRIQDLVREVFDTEEPPADSLQGLWDLGIDVDKPLCIALGGLPMPQPVVLVSLHDPDAFSDFYYSSIQEEKPEPIENYAEAEIRLSRGIYSAQTGGLFIASESFPLLKSCLDALVDPEKRFFASESVRPLIEHYQDATACVLIDLSSIRGFLTLALTQAPAQVPEMVRDWLTKVQSVGLGLKVQPEGLRFSAVACGDFTGVDEPKTELPVPRDCLAFIGGDKGQVPLEEKQGIAGMLVGILSMFPQSSEFIATVGEENLVSLVQSIGGGSFLFLTDAGWMPGVTFGLKLDDPALFKLIYDEKLRPLLKSALEAEMGAVLDRRTEGDVDLDELTLGGPISIPLKPALAFYDGYLVLTTDSGMVGKIRDVDLGRAEGISSNEDYRLIESQLPGYRLVGFASVDKLVKLLAMTPGLELPEAVQILGDHYALVSVGVALDGGVAEAVLLVSTRAYLPDGAVPQTEITRGLPWWLWLVIGLGAAIIIVLVVVLAGRRRREE